MVISRLQDSLRSDDA